MKRFLAVLMGCMLITGTFASCGSDDDSSEVRSTIAGTTAADDDEVSASSEKTTGSDTEKDTEEPETEAPSVKTGEKTSESSGTEIDSELVGAWDTSEEGYNGAYVFNADGTGDILLYFGDMLYFKGDSLVVEGTELPSDMYSFDGTHFSLVLNGMDVLTMDKTTSGQGLDGTYKVKSGAVYDEVSGEYGGLSFNIEVKGGKCTGIFENCFGYTADGKKVSLTSGNAILGVGEFSYKVNGDEMVAESGGTKQYFTRKK